MTLPVKTINNYKVVSELGRGGMGIVYKGWDEVLERSVALKMIVPQYAQNQVIVDRFTKEARSLARLHHPNIVKVYGAERTGKGLVIVMEFVEGITLEDYLKASGALSQEKALVIITQCLKAIENAHGMAEPVIHRDLKPANILISEKDGNIKAKLADFGLAKILRSETEVGLTMIAGTPGYMPPEQAMGLADHRSDIYALGVILHELLTGTKPTQQSIAPSPVEEMIETVVVNESEQAEKNQGEQSPSVPEAFAEIIQKATEKAVENRYQSATEMLTALAQVTKPKVTSEGVKTGKEKSAKKNESDEPVKPPKPSNLKWLGIIAAVLLLGSSYFFFTSEPNESEKEPQHQGLPVVTTDLPARLQVASAPSSATVAIDTLYRETTPFKANDLAPGDYILHFTKPGFLPLVDTLRLAAGSDCLYVATLQAVPTIPKKPSPNQDKQSPPAVKNAGILLTSDLPANIYIGGEQMHQSADRFEATIAAGSHTVRFEHATYGTATFTITVRDGKENTLACYFEREIPVQSLSSTGEAQTAAIFVDGEATDEYTPGFIKLPPGTYQINALRIGFESNGSKKVVIKPGTKKRLDPLIFTLTDIEN